MNSPKQMTAINKLGCSSLIDLFIIIERAVAKHADRDKKPKKQ
jgi:hypothetical protein